MISTGGLSLSLSLSLVYLWHNITSASFQKPGLLRDPFGNPAKPVASPVCYSIISMLSGGGQNR